MKPHDWTAADDDAAWAELSADLSREANDADHLRYAVSATAERLREYSGLVYTASYNETQRQSVEAHIARLQEAVEELISLRAERQ